MACAAAIFQVLEQVSFGSPLSDIVIANHDLGYVIATLQLSHLYQSLVTWCRLLHKQISVLIVGCST